MLDVSTWRLVESVPNEIVFYSLAILFDQEFPEQIDGLEVTNDIDMAFSSSRNQFIPWSEAIAPEYKDAIKQGHYHLNLDKFNPEAEILKIKNGKEVGFVENFSHKSDSDEETPFEIYDWMRELGDIDNLADSAVFVINCQSYSFHDFGSYERLNGLQWFFEEHPQYLGFPFTSFMLAGKKKDYDKALVFLRLYALVTDSTFLDIPNEQ